MYKGINTGVYMGGLFSLLAVANWRGPQIVFMVVIFSAVYSSFEQRLWV